MDVAVGSDAAEEQMVSADQVAFDSAAIVGRLAAE